VEVTALFASRTHASKRTRNCIIALLALCLVALAAAAPAQARPQYRGVQVHSLWYESSNADMDRELDMARDLGANLIRVDVAWGNIEWDGKGKHSNWYVPKLDRFMDGASARGMKVVAALWSTPCWASSAPESLKQGCSEGWWGRGVASYPPNNPEDYGDIARWVTSRYGSKLAALEVWNEPNLENKFFLRSDDPAGAYATLLRAAYPKAKAGDGSVPVLAGSLAGADKAFLALLYARGIRGSYDGLAVHPYADPTWSGLEAFRAVQQAAGDNAPVWATEFGWSTATTGWGVNEQAQANHLRSAIAGLDQLSYVQAASVYNLRDKGTVQSSMEDNFGLVRRDFSAKPAYRAVQEALGAPPAAAPAPRSAPATRRVSRKKARITLRLRKRQGSTWAEGKAPARSRVRLRVTRCPRAARAVTVRAGRNGKFKRRLGSSRRMGGCRVIAQLA
jgi:polysaccharide biosynthesis protein PslG